MTLQNEDLLAVYRKSTTSAYKLSINDLQSYLGGGGSSLWELDSNTLKPVDSNNNVVIGNANITLKADGNAIFSQSIQPGFLYINNANPAWESIQLLNSGTKKIIMTAGGNVLIGGTLPAAPNITLNADGSAVATKYIAVRDTGGNKDLALECGSSSVNGAHYVNVVGGGIGNNFGYKLMGQWSLYSNTSTQNELNIAIPNDSLGQPGTVQFTAGTVEKVTINRLGKVTSASTESTDSGTTLVTKDYIAGYGGSGGIGTFGYWNRTNTGLNPVNNGDSVYIGSGNITLEAAGNARFKNKINVSTASTAGSRILFNDPNTGGNFPKVGCFGDTLRLSGGGTDEDAMNIDQHRNVLIGGTLPSVPNITLNADGSGTFEGTITAGKNAPAGDNICLQNKGAYSALSSQRSSGSFIFGYGVKGAATDKDDYISTNDLTTAAAVAYVQGGERSAELQNGHSFLSTDGANGAVTDSPVDLKKKFHMSGLTGDVYIGPDLKLRGDQNILLRADGSIDAVGTVKIGGTLPAAPNITLFAAGTGVFGTNPYAGGGTGVSVIHSGTVRAGAISGTPLWQGYKNGTTDPTSSITAQGSAQFAGQVISGTGEYSTGDNASLHPQGSVSASRTSTSDVVWAGYTTGNTTATSTIDAAGSSTFAGNVRIGGTLPALPNITLNADGSIVTTADASINGVTVGRGAGNVAYNTVCGYRALYANTTGSNNTAAGINALYSNTEGNSNTAYGIRALYYNTTGTNNTAAGGDALFSNTAGDHNIAIGVAAGYYIEGSNNTILGSRKGTAADATLNDTVIISAGTTERLRINSTGSLLFGGTLPAAPNITLNADGSAEFTGPQVDFGSTSGSKIRFARPIDGAKSCALGFDSRFEAVSDNNKFGLFNSSGGAQFNIGLVESAGSRFSVQTLNSSTSLFEEVASIDNSGAAEFAGTVKIGGTLPASPKISLFSADGSARFSGAVNVGAGLAYAGGADGVHLNQAGYMALSRPVGSNNCFLAYVTGSSTPTIEFTAAGSARFSGNVRIPGGGGATDALQKQEIEALISSGGGGSTPTLQEVTDQGSHTRNSISVGGLSSNPNIKLNTSDGKITAKIFDIESLTTLP